MWSIAIYDRRLLSEVFESALKSFKTVQKYICFMEKEFVYFFSVKRLF